MRLHRFYIEEQLGDGEMVLRDEAVLHQLRDVFRLQKGDRVIFFNGEGADYIYEAKIISKKEAGFGFVEKTANIMLSKKVTLFMSLIKKDDFELVLQKGTEIGVSHFVPVITERTQSKNLNMERAEKIMREASEQCGRGDVPALSNPMDLSEVLNKYKNVIVCDMSGGSIQGTSNKSQVEILIGPEGGWSEKEINLFKDLNIQTFKLGETVLRAETAAVVASALILTK